MSHRSPFSRLQPLPSGAFQIEDAFWSPRLAALQNVTLPQQFHSMEVTGRIDNFRRAAGLFDGPHRGFVFNDSDVYKWVEAAARAGHHPAYAEEMDTIIHLSLAAQQTDGYLNTAFMFDKAGARWSNIRDDHELYSAGHFIEAALSLHRSGDDRLLPAAHNLADLICSLFGPEEDGKRPVVPGHEEIEIALIALYRATGEKRYLQQASFFIEARGYGLVGGLPYHQDHMPFRELDKMTGHAVRALYLNIAAADLYLETGDKPLFETLVRLWERLYTRQVYVTGGLGARHSGEAFGDDYELPNEKAYSETCASVAAILWNWRMLQATGDARYADAIETTLYNAALAGISQKGDTYFYTNPLASSGVHRRAQYFNCACCPPNIARLLASLSDFFCSTSEGTAWIHQYASGKLEIPVGQQTVRLRIQTAYPREGKVEICVERPGIFAMNLRIPAWAGTAELQINEEGFTTERPGYVNLKRQWQAGDCVTLLFPMKPHFVVSHPAVLDNTGRVALVSGPLVYCVESTDPHPEELRIDTTAPIRAVDAGAWHNLDLKAMYAPQHSKWQSALYQDYANEADSEKHSIRIIAVPYFNWANSDPMPMRVWLRK